MDESENKQESSSATGSVARETADFLKADAEKTIGDIRNRGVKGFFSFDHMYFPGIANFVFIVIVVLSLVGTTIGVLLGIASIFSTGVFAGLAAIIGSVIGGAVGILFTRISFEMILVAFKINEGIQAMREKR